MLKARIRRRQRIRKLILITITVAIIAAVIVVVYALSSMGSPNEQFVGKQISASLYQRLYSVAHSSYNNLNNTLLSKIIKFDGQPLISSGKPLVLYIGAEYCPYCAFQRWPLIISLMRFGNFTNLRYMLSSPSDVYPNTPTFTFYHSTYESKYISFQAYEEQDRYGNMLEKAPANYTSIFQHFGSSYPFLDIGNKYVTVGSFYFPTLLAGKNWTQITQLLGDNNTLSNQIISSANVITAAICKVTGNLPVDVCGEANISKLTSSLVAYTYSLNTSFKAGNISDNPNTWATVQYGQIACITKSSMNTKYETPITATAQAGIRTKVNSFLLSANKVNMTTNQTAPSNATGTPANLL